MRRGLLAILGLGLGGLCLWLSSRSVDWTDARRIFRSAVPADLGLGALLFIAAALLRCVRWRVLLAFQARIPLGIVALALFAGYAMNSILPARLGEFFRAHYIGRLAGISRSGALASIVIERLLDLIVVIVALAVGLGLSGTSDSGSRRILAGGAALAVVAVLTLVAIATLLDRYGAERALSVVMARLPAGPRIARRLGGTATEFARTLQVVRTRHFFFALLLTLPIWALEACAMWQVCRAVGITLQPSGMLSLLGGASLSTLVPTAPGYVGSYQMAFVVILKQFGITATSAIVAATAVQIYLIGTCTAIGLLLLFGATLRGAFRARPPSA